MLKNFLLLFSCLFIYLVSYCQKNDHKRLSSFLDQDLTQILLEKIGSLSKELDSTKRILKWTEREAERTIVNAQQSVGFISLLERLENKQQLTKEDSSFILYSINLFGYSPRYFIFFDTRRYLVESQHLCNPSAVSLP